MQMMRRRDELTFRQEMKFRNKLVEYLTDWIMGNSHQVNVQGDICSMSRSVKGFLFPSEITKSFVVVGKMLVVLK